MNGSNPKCPRPRPRRSIVFLFCEGVCGAQLKGRLQPAEVLYNHLVAADTCRESYVSDDVCKGGCLTLLGLPLRQLVITPTIHYTSDTHGRDRGYTIVGLGVNGNRVDGSYVRNVVIVVGKVAY